MIFLPIARRELRVAAGRRSTLWLRLAGALAALVIGCMVFAIQMASNPVARVGSTLFAILSWLACFAALSVGLFFTSDSLSEEKREGTLGFLFLTDLRGYDVVSGKLLAAALRGLYMLLAAFPILAITLLMGGVTGAAFWKTCLALLNALFVSLVAGAFISSISRDAQKAILGTMLLIFGWASAGYVIDVLRSQTLFKLSSPFFVFGRASSIGPAFFWEALLVNQIIAWILFAASSYLAERTWHDKPEKTSSVWAAFAHWLKYGSAQRQERLRVKLMGVNPVTWLACRERWQAASFWVIAALAVASVILFGTVSSPSARSRFWPFVAIAFVLTLYIGFASQACRFFVETRRNGLLELLLSTSLSPQRIIEGQWAATLRMFGLPVMAFVAAYFIGNFIVHQSSAGASPVAGLATAAADTLATPFDLAALTWFGMWMGLISKNANTAAWRTVFFAMVLPMLVLVITIVPIVFLVLIPILAPSAAWTDFVATSIPTAGSLAIDWWLYRFARRKLSSELRQRAALAQGRGG